MENKDKSKANILEGVHQKLKRREIKIAVLSVVVCILIGIIAYLILFVKQTSISADLFKEVHIETKIETIHQLEDRELLYNHLVFSINRAIFYENRYFYIENKNDDNTSTLYFYMSENYIQKSKNKKLKEKHKTEGSINANMLLYPDLCKTDKINEITKVYYLVYDYNKVNQQDFDKIKSEAMLLWEK